jgi:nucleotidyltransferase substrate binding protein (TIGR01987 family)
MSIEKLILTPLQKAIESLTEVIAQPKDEFIRDATIQRFEYTYELSWKMIKRHLVWAGFSDVPPTVKDLFREAAKIGLISDAEKWFDYHQARNETSHTYDEDTAEEVYQVALKFLSDAQSLLAELRKHHG